MSAKVCLWMCNYIACPIRLVFFDSAVIIVYTCWLIATFASGSKFTQYTPCSFAVFPLIHDPEASKMTKWIALERMLSNKMCYAGLMNCVLAVFLLYQNKENVRSIIDGQWHRFCSYQLITAIKILYIYSYYTLTAMIYSDDWD